ncbi:MAG: RluA family pseudouridine synthase [Verrucomicrobiae bacterium]|nr:RluA family pseudouridine synthase [Verrucomicrobiae bacterium]MCP5550497.1 RluA family pseudouridine synthase [Akkermansiaceae bacterium]
MDLRLYNADFTVIDETADRIVVDKPPHLMVHPSVPGNPPTLWDGLRELLAFEIANGGRLSIITRLDRETSGVVLVAKHGEAARVLHEAMRRGEFRKEYEAIVWGWPREDVFEVEAPLIRRGEVEASPVWVRQTVHPRGKPSRTRFRVRERFERATSNGDRFARLACEPVTGRMHQIRAHLQHAGFPIVGDKLYGPGEDCYLTFIETGWTPDLEGRLLLNRQALHAGRLGWGDLVWESPLPADLQSFMDRNP